jgi:hypothetical protein
MSRATYRISGTKSGFRPILAATAVPFAGALSYRRGPQKTKGRESGLC